MATDSAGYFSDPEAPGQSRFEFSDKKIRLAFIRKVYAILGVQLIVTFGFVALFVLHSGIRTWARENSWLFWASWSVTLVMIIVLACCGDIRRRAPANFICLGIFTLAESLTVGTICSRYNADSVLLAVGATAVICLALTIFAFQTKIDFTAWGAALYVILIVFCLFGILMIFLPRSSFPILHIVYAAVGTLIFAFYLIYDTQLMMGGKHKYAISPEEYIFAALNLYLDIIQIFMYLLYLFGSKD